MNHSECKERNCFSVKEFCYRNGIGRTTAYKEIAAGKLRTKKVGRRTLISCEEEQRWFAQDATSHGERRHD
jgi:excisionase family DNA binding protein